jgi:hypothetical protein
VQADLTDWTTQLPDRHTTWLATSNADGTPHVAAVGALPIDGVLCVISGLGTHKSRHLAREPAASSQWRRTRSTSSWRERLGS